MKTIIDLFEESVAKYNDRPFLWEKNNGAYLPTTYTQTLEKVYACGAGLLALGVEKGDSIALLSEGRNEWVISELGILYTGAVNVPLSVKLNESKELLFRLRHSDTKYIIVSERNLSKIRPLIHELPLLKKIILLDELQQYEPKEMYIGEIYNMGDKLLKNNPGVFEDVYKSIQPGDYANISYTSGTTADPKGIILSHRNYTANVEQAMSLMTITPDYKTLIILPLDHCFAHVAGFYTFMAFGAGVATVAPGKNVMETLKNISINIREIQPDVLMSVPALAKNFKKNIESGIKQKGAIIEKLFNHALKVAYRYNGEGFNKGQNAGILDSILLKAYDKLIFSKVREAFGGKLKFFIGGGALLDLDLQKFFYAIGIPMLQGYGLSEATPIISANSLERHKLGSSGYLVKNLDLKICDTDGKELPVGETGEIVVKGENVMVGYWQNKSATAETIRDGWLFTGDMGRIDKDEFLYVSGRFKSLLISNDGEKYSPEGIEESLVENSPYIEQVMLHNNQNAYTVALIVPDIHKLKTYVQQKHKSWETEEGIKVALGKIQKEINEYKKGGKFAGIFPECWLPAAVGILDEAFTEQNHFLNSTMKIVRGKIIDHYRDRITELYTPHGKNIHNDLNIQSLNINISS